MLTLWFSLFMAIAMYFVFVRFLGPETSNEAETPGNIPLTATITALGAVLVLLSFVVKRKLLERSVQQQRVELVQQALVFACAICEVSALLGVLERFLIDGHAYYLLFLISAMGVALHFPRREQLLSATYKTFQNGRVS